MTILEALPYILYGLGAILLVILIIVSFKLLRAMIKIERVVDDVEVKVKSLNKFFKVIDLTTDKLSLVSDKVVDAITGIIMSVFKKKKNKKEEEIYEEEI